MVRSSVALLVVAAVAACGDDGGARRLADAPPFPDTVPLDAPDDAPITQPTDLELAITRGGNGTGTVTSTPAGIDCGATCTAAFEENTMITLSAEPATGSLFTGWSGGCSGTTPVCEVTLTAATSVTATFTLETFTVSVEKLGAGDGTITGNGLSCDPTCTIDVDYGTAISLTATPIALSNFIGWGGACTGTAACALTITGDTSITAAFALDEISLLVSRGGNGAGTISSTPAGIACPGDCDHIYTANQMVTLTATPAASSTFTGWSGACTNATGTCVVTMDAAKTVTASFTLRRYQLDIERDGTGMGSVTSEPSGIACGTDCDEMYDHGTEIELTATPQPGNMFAGWSGACSGMGTCTVTLNAAATATATFTLNTYALGVTITGTGSVMGADIACPGDCTGTYTHGTVVPLTQLQGTGYTFTGWGGDCGGSGACSLTMDAAKAVTATFTINSYNLTVSTTGMGTVMGAQIDCGADCTGTFTHGTNVTLSHDAADGYTFSSWGGACSGSGACVVPMTMMQAVTATFTINSYALTAGTGGSGTGTVTATGISCPGDCTESFTHGTVVAVSQSAAASSTFSSWSGACTGSGACSVTMDDMKSVVANFTIRSHDLTITPPSNGSITGAQINCGADCIGTFIHDTMVTLTPNPAVGYDFGAWGGACTGSGACVVTMNAAKTVSATFTLKSYVLTVNPPANGTITGNGINCPGTCTAMVSHGTPVSLTATPAAHFQLSSWSGACTGSAGCAFTMIDVATVGATFGPDSHDLSVAISPAGGGTVTGTQINCPTDCAGTYVHGTDVTLTAMPSSGYVFASWSGACTGATCTVDMASAQSVTANFTPVYRLTIDPEGNGSGTVTATGISCGADCTEDYLSGTSVMLTATPTTPGSTFAGWGGDGCAGMASTCTVSMTMARTVTATFQPTKHLLTVNVTGAGTVSSAPAGISSCAATSGDCMENYDYGTLVTLTPAGNSASAETATAFTGWTGVCAAFGTGPCVVTMTAAATVGASFVLAPNIIFVTSLPYTSNLGGLDDANKKCNDLAGPKGLIGTGAGQNSRYVAFLSALDNQTGLAINFSSRLIAATPQPPGQPVPTPASGWVRPGDLKPVFNTLNDLGANRVFYPPRHDESGADLANGGANVNYRVWTGSTATGAYHSQCTGNGGAWTGQQGSLVRYGVASASSGNAASLASHPTCDGMQARLLCLGADRRATVTVTPVPSQRRAFTTRGTYNPTTAGLGVADAMCRQEALQAGLGDNFRAFLPDPANGLSAIGRFNTTTDGRTWVRTSDLQPIVARAGDLTQAIPALITAPNSDPTGSSRYGAAGSLFGDTIHAGSKHPRDASSAGADCAAWTNADAPGTGGFAGDTAISGWWDSPLITGRPCNEPQRKVVCFEN